MDVTDIVRILCEDLGIEMIDAPIVIPDESQKMAMYDIDENVIYVNPNGNGIIIFYYIAHEMRHVWQHQMAEVNGRPEYIALFNEYNSYDDYNDKDEYNLQPLEIDAIAYATIITEERFEVKLGRPGTEDAVEEAIKARIDEISRERKLKKNP